MLKDALRLLFGFTFKPALTAHCGISAVSAQYDLLAFIQYVSVIVEPCRNSRFCAALAYGFYLRYGFRYFKKPFTALEKMIGEIASKPETQHGYVEIDNYIAELVYLFGRQKLTLVDDYDVVIAVFFGVKLI